MQIKHIHIQNFKSIRNLKLDVRRVNVFIGEPNTGKTNVVEALSLFAEHAFVEENFRKLVRFQNLGDIFFDNDITKTVEVKIDKFVFRLLIVKGPTHFGGFKGGVFEDKSPGIQKTSEIVDFDLDQKGKAYNLNKLKHFDIRRYIFEKLEKFQPLVAPYLNPPFGDNLPQILNNHPDLYKLVSDILRDRDFKLLLRPVESEIHLAKEVNGKLTSFPFQTMSETWKRIIFLLAILETNKNQVLLLDEPEANIFPFFNTQIAETIGLYNKNQFFITTHNPYLLQSLIAKTPKDELCVFVTRMENFETKVQQMDSEQLSEAIDLGASIFSNLDDIIAAV